MNTDQVLKEIHEASLEIPFENSQFQTDHFVVKGQLVPTRAYRAILLRLNDRIQALNEAKYAVAREEIDIDEINDKIKTAKEGMSPDTFAIRRLELDLAQKIERKPFTEKLVRDALVEVNHLYALFKQFPKYTREQFEDGEKAYFVASLTRQQLQIDGAAGAMLDIGIIPEGLLPNLDACTHDKELDQIVLSAIKGIDSPVELSGIEART